MELIHKGWDTIDLSFQGAIPKKYIELLAEAKELAQLERREVALDLGLSNTKVKVGETGRKGGYRYQVDYGPDKEIWWFAHSTDPEKYNIFVSVKSLNLALNGFLAVKKRLLKRLNDLEAYGPYKNESAYQALKPEEFPLIERINRIDYCLDFVMDSAFNPDPKRFVAHQRSKKHVYTDDEKSGNGKKYSALNGEKVSTVRVGEMPNRQAVLYNKTQEITVSQKRYWWKLWGINPDEFDLKKKQIWRIEIRAGKSELDKWSLKRFEDFEKKSGDVISAILSAIRYTDPLINDDNRSRWPMHEMWSKALNVSSKALNEHISGAKRESIIRGLKEDKIHIHKNLILGNAISLTAAEGRDVSEITAVLDDVQNEIHRISMTDKEFLLKRFQKAQDKFIHLD